MAEFQQPLDIVNRALQHLRVMRAGAFTEDSPQARETAFVYGKLRRAELRRNAWRYATRRVALGALGNGTVFLVPTAYAAGTTYQSGAIVTYAGAMWISTKDTNLGNTPGSAPTTGAYPWEGYYGPLTVSLYDEDISYHAGELVYTTPNNGTYTIYASLVEGNDSDPAEVDEWDSTLTYASGDVASFDGTNYQSRIALNLDNEPDTSPTQWTSTVANPAVSGSWRTIAATISSIPINYPLTTGPSGDPLSRNAFRLPSNFLKEAPQAPKAGAMSYLGAGPGLFYDDWEYEGNYIISGDPAILFRFIADIQDVSQMDDQFCECIAARIALEVGPILVPSRWSELEPGVTRRLNDVMSEARLIDAIERGPIEAYEDEYIRVRY